MGKNRGTSESKATGGGAKQDALLPPVRGHTPALIALYWPNIVTYYRVVLVFGCVALHSFEWHGLFIVVYAIASVLDALDGYLARLFVQATKYGEVLDVVVDMYVRFDHVCHVCLESRSRRLLCLRSVQRSLLWSLVGANTKALEAVVFAVIGLEWMTFAVMHARCVRAAAVLWRRWYRLGVLCHLFVLTPRACCQVHARRRPLEEHGYLDAAVAAVHVLQWFPEPARCCGHRRHVFRSAVFVCACILASSECVDAGLRALCGVRLEGAGDGG